MLRGLKEKEKKYDLLPKNHEGGMKGLDQGPGQGHSPVGQGSRSSCKYLKVELKFYKLLKGFQQSILLRIIYQSVRYCSTNEKQLHIKKMASVIRR